MTFSISITFILVSAFSLPWRMVNESRRKREKGQKVFLAFMLPPRSILPIRSGMNKKCCLASIPEWCKLAVKSNEHRMQTHTRSQGYLRTKEINKGFQASWRPRQLRQKKSRKFLFAASFTSVAILLLNFNKNVSVGRLVKGARALRFVYIGITCEECLGRCRKSENLSGEWKCLLP